MNLASSIFGKQPGEADDVFAARHQDLERTFRNVLANAEGHKLVQLLLTHRNPVHPRFGGGRSNEEAAFRDGQCDVIATLMLYGTNLGISKPE